VDEEGIGTGFDRDGTERLVEVPDVTVDRHEEEGYLIATEDFGSYRISPGGDRIEAAPPSRPPWWWQRCLIGRVLPLAALLQGLETLHASAVSREGRVLAFAGASERGKTSVALNLVVRGAGFLTDDVLAMEASDSAVTAYPGAGITHLRHEEAERMVEGRDRLGEVLGDDGESLRTLVPRDGRPRPLAALYFLDRRAESDIAFERISSPGPQLLLAGSFNLIVRTPQRLKTQLHVCARIAQIVPSFWIRIPPSATAAALAPLIEAHARETVIGEGPG